MKRMISRAMAEQQPALQAIVDTQNYLISALSKFQAPTVNAGSKVGAVIFVPSAATTAGSNEKSELEKLVEIASAFVDLQYISKKKPKQD